MTLSNKYIEIPGPPPLSWQTIPTATRYLSFAYVLFTVALWSTRRTASSTVEDPQLVICPIVQLVPSQILKFPYSLLLSNLVDVELWKFVVDLLNLIIGGTYIESYWNSPQEMLKYTLMIGTATNLVMCLVTFVLSFFITSIRLEYPLDGNYTMLIGFAIVYKQLLPETTIIEIRNVPFISKNFRFKLYPIFLLCTLTLSQVFWYHNISELISIWTTFFTCWLYLRFYQVLPSAVTGNVTADQVVGDASDTFQLLYFFPDIIKPVLRPIFDKSYNLAIEKYRWRTPFMPNDIELGNSLTESRVKSDITVTEERRKQLALQVLEQRINSDKEQPQ
ncbi:AEL079Wp [Eremothecium gossypii ATCC 10895]|uniref:AEL079Wp n=1 Tax=Eremothecium gossypii (strain ATCC 10895 / CBS 109.51 / FGSC 9923 / NRRL Y-1056) TaxID=284811 RepID=Q757U1_EREGS|nr:AEL079Wp [Eremothecium gossypii ATCC 10895]AAS52606.1 AEL079Wp [Eremothecium gossypii ATCC 10895]AEY96909.1 FAEL079Wp [Eremothecium gossypii FDAG1]